MKMQLDVQKLKEYREAKAWSQSHLSEVAGISLRTIQRIEKSGMASLESAKSICASYDIQIIDLLVNDDSNVKPDPTILASVRDNVNKMDKKSALVSFFIAFIIAFFLTF